VGKYEDGMETVPLIELSPDKELGIQNTIWIDEDVLMTAKMILDSREQLRTKKKRARARLKQKGDMILEDQMRDDDKKMNEMNKEDTEIPSSQFIAVDESDPGAAPECQDDSQLRSKSMASLQVRNSCARSVQYKNDIASQSTQDQDLQSADDRTDSTMWTPSESGLGSSQNSLDINTEQAFRKPTLQEIQLAILEIVKEVARGL
jgi:hypothetical protein